MRRILLQIYTKNREEAFEFYKKAFNAELGYCDRAEDGTIIHSELNFCGQSIAVGELDENQSEMIVGNTMQFCLQFEPGEEHIIKQAYETMKEGGNVLYPLGSSFFSSYNAALIDKYGVYWCLFI
ncbi:VOC family protein [Clostridium sp. Marseille-P299]|uniref:VOC family protein n=1 Tax=Clostridium sp. Marseille-P299 TaxID=1805477 RepID=UPI00082FD7C8|nr:hypothetical protein [Clostridium sp. Marseille-P299]